MYRLPIEKSEKQNQHVRTSKTGKVFTAGSGMKNKTPVSHDWGVFTQEATKEINKLAGKMALVFNNRKVKKIDLANAALAFLDDFENIDNGKLPGSGITDSAVSENVVDYVNKALAKRGFTLNEIKKVASKAGYELNSTAHLERIINGTKKGNFKVIKMDQNSNKTYFVRDGKKYVFEASQQNKDYDKAEQAEMVKLFKTEPLSYLKGEYNVEEVR